MENCYLPPKSKVAAGILAILVGSLGVHNFYIRRPGRGLIQLLATVLSVGFLAPIVCVWSIVEGVLIITSDEGAIPWGVDGRGVPLK